MRIRYDWSMPPIARRLEAIALKAKGAGPETLALLKILALGERQVAQGRWISLAEARRRLRARGSRR